MALHPREANWFEVYIPRHQTVYALEAFARMGTVELDRDIVADPVVDTGELRAQLRAFERVRQRCEDHLPGVAADPVPTLEHPEATLREANRSLRSWCARSLKCRRARERLLRQLSNIGLLEECAEAMGEEAGTLADLAHASGVLYKRIHACPSDNRNPSPAEARGHASVIEGKRHVFHIVADVPEHEATLERDASFRHCLAVDVPVGLPASADALRRELADRRTGTEAELAALEVTEKALQRDEAIRKALGVADVLQWYLDKSITLTENRRYCHVTGWTSAPSAESLQRTLRLSGIDGVIMFHSPPPGRRPAVTAERGPLARPFGVFVDMLGTPEAVEVDPTPWLAIIVPLLFGYMFPDVGHGLVLAAAGLLLGGRLPAIRLLVPCGLAAAAFGIPFGEVFGLEGVLEPLLWSPLEQPLWTLSVPVFFGAFLILLGMGFAGLGAYWRGEGGQWLSVDLALVLVYLGILGAIWRLEVAMLALVGALWFLWGAGLAARGTLPARLAAAGGWLLERVFQLVMNTISFVRVGAFALGHAALSNALLEIASLVHEPTTRIALLAIGHLFIILLEGLVVFVQTTRLVLFEFFTRFLRGEGRAFRPLTPPVTGRRD
jgi:V/A-type H+-transporting ATPase subunit I